MRLYREVIGDKELFLGEKCVFFPAGGGYFEGIKTVVAFSSERATFAFKSGLVEVEGENLEIGKICDGDVFISGKIRSVVYEHRT